MKAKIKDVVKNSIADRLGIKGGDILVSINDNKIKDIIDYKFLIADEKLSLKILKTDGEIREFKIKKSFDEDLGIIFENHLIDRERSCRNRCIFCFVDQLPPNLRRTLYYKDDDYRLSFLCGNFVTLTNLNEEDFERIKEYRLSPLYVSVHATDDEIRVRMMGNKKAGNIIETLKELAEHKIIMHCQVVLCPGINDGKVLDKTIRDLASLWPSVKSVAVVPVGVTRFREGLYPLRPYGRVDSLKVLRKITKWQMLFKKKMGTSFVFASDEFYLKAKVGIPNFNHYEDFPQLENGVGLIAKFEKEFYDAIRNTRLKPLHKNSVSIATGVLAYPFIRKWAGILRDITGMDIKVYEIINRFFGQHITVAGLVTGRDIINQLLGKDLGEKLIIPDCMLRDGENIFLDDLSVEDLEKKLSIPIKIVEVNGKSFVDAIIHF